MWTRIPETKSNGVRSCINASLHNLASLTFAQPTACNISVDAWQRACEQAEITNFRWHDLRHTWASWHVQNDTSLQELMELGG